MSSILKLPKLAAPRFAATEAFEALGEAWFAPFSAVRVPGTVLWVNFELARELGFDVPRSNQLTPALQEQLLAKLSLRAVASGDDTAGAGYLFCDVDRYCEVCGGPIDS